MNDAFLTISATNASFVAPWAAMLTGVYATYRPRWSMVLRAAALGMFLGGACGLGITVVGVLIRGPRPADLMIATTVVAAIIAGAIAATSIRARTLTVTDDGLVADRDGCRITLSWSDFEQVRRRVIGPVTVEELVFRRAHLQCSDDWAWLSRLAARRLRHAGADRRLQPALYAPDWRDSILGQVGRPEPGNSNRSTRSRRVQPFDLRAQRSSSPNMRMKVVIRLMSAPLVIVVALRLLGFLGRRGYVVLTVR